MFVSGGVPGIEMDSSVDVTETFPLNSSLQEQISFWATPGPGTCFFWGSDMEILKEQVQCCHVPGPSTAPLDHN